MNNAGGASSTSTSASASNGEEQTDTVLTRQEVTAEKESTPWYPDCAVPPFGYHPRKWRTVRVPVFRQPYVGQNGYVTGGGISSYTVATYPPTVTNTTGKSSPPGRGNQAPNTGYQPMGTNVQYEILPIAQQLGMTNAPWQLWYPVPAVPGSNIFGQTSGVNGQPMVPLMLQTEVPVQFVGFPPQQTVIPGTSQRVAPYRFAKPLFRR